MKQFKLDNKEKREPFQAPEHYFDDFPLRMQKRIETGKAMAKRDFPALFSRRGSLVAVPFMLLLAAGTLLWYSLRDTEKTANPLACIATTELLYYLEMETMNADELIRGIGQTELIDSLWEDTELKLLPQEEMSDEDLLFLYDQLSTQEEVL